MAREHGLYTQILTNLLDINRLAFVVKCYTARNHSQIWQLGQAVVDAFGDSVGNIFRVGIITSNLKR